MKISTADKILCQSPSTLKEQQSGICFLHMEAEKTAVHRLDTLIHGELAKFLWGLFLDYFKNLSVVLKQNLKDHFPKSGQKAMGLVLLCIILECWHQGRRNTNMTFHIIRKRELF